MSNESSTIGWVGRCTGSHRLAGVATAGLTIAGYQTIGAFPMVRLR